ncbi:VWA domain-containing protein [Pseudozobellia sp. WGM2]|uniref:vWA domain-containing protein n=1 Tax=Pseudozobellia sp. WGM2 TaxID=2787625 RepID=UPI001AE097DB|nr:vWA domain-containing protein [Pseudozobellia sp. WGM2]
MKTKRLIFSGLLLAFTVSIYSCEFKKERNSTKSLLAEVLPENDKEIEPKKNTVQIALLLDTSNSMDGLINQAKAQLWDVVNKFTHAKCGDDSRPDLQIALYQYGNDNLSYREGYVQQVLDFTGDLDEISEKLFSLTTNGGEEFCGTVIHKSLRQLNWAKNPDNLKMIFIAGNEPFTQGETHYKDAASNAKEKDVIVNTIFCGNYEQGIHGKWKEGALLAGGDYMAIDHNREIVHINTPYDDAIIDYNTKLNDTYISYGSLGSLKKEKQAAQDDNAAELQEAVVVKRAVSKSSRLYNNKDWDLVDASNEEDFSVGSVDKEDLPKELRNKSPEEIETYISEKKQERAKIQEKIQELNKKREKYIVENQDENKSGELENAMINAIKKQAEEKNYRWD